jgi:hypothetical protein
MNLVPNPSFEDTINIHPGCRQSPHVCFLDEFIVGWRGLPLYYSEIFPQSIEPLGISNSRGVPSNCVGYQNARSGIAYSSVTTFQLSPNNLSIRYNIQSKLIQTLQSGKKYKVEFYVSQADSLHYANNSIGAFFSADSFAVIYSYLIDSIPQIQNQANNSLDNTSDWVRVCDTMTANGTERYMTIGNFLPDSLSDTLYLGGGCVSSTSLSLCGSLYYIDDVSVTLIDDTGLEESAIPPLHFYPNPGKAILTIENPGRRIKRIQVLSVSGAVLMRQEKVETNTVSVDLSSLAPGLYFLQAEDGDGGVRIGNFVKE